MSGSISQMQMVYSAEEDRILFRVNSTDKKEFRFWITRRYVNLIVRALRDHLNADPDISSQGTTDAQQAVKAFKQEKAVKEANFNQQFEEGSNDMPLGSEAVLAFKLTYNLQGENMHLGIQPKEGQGINMVINRQINASLSQLLAAAVQKAGWNLEDGQAQEQAAEMNKSRIIN